MWREDVIEPPESVRAAAKAAFEKRDRDVEIADLVFDSVLDDPGRELAQGRVLRFEAGTQAIEASVLEDASGVHVRLRTDPPLQSEGVVRQNDHELAISTDARGAASICHLRHGITAVMLVRPTPQRPVRTTWVKI